MSDLFISYSRLDGEFVSRLAARLRELKRDVWVDLDKILLAEKWLDKVYSGIDEANHFAFIISPDSVLSSVCQKELARAVDGHKRLLPVLFRPLDGKPRPPVLGELNWITPDRPGDLDSCVAKLLLAMDTDPEWVNLHTMLQVRARGWEQGKQDTGSELRGLELQRAIQWLGEAAKQKEPKPTQLQIQFIQSSQQSEAKEIARLTQLYASALARQLAAQAELAREQQASLIERSVLLAVESLRTLPTPEGTEVLRRSLALLPPCHRVLQAGAQVTDVKIAPAGNLMAVSAGTSALLWSLPEASSARVIPHPAAVNALAFHPAGKFLATAIGDFSANPVLQGVYIFDLEAWRPVLALPHPDRVLAVAWHPKFAYLTTSCGDNAVRLWDLNTATEVFRVTHNGQAEHVAYSPDGSVLACAGMFDSCVLLYPADFKTQPKRLDHAFADKVTAIAFSSDGKMLAAADGFNVGQTSTFPIRVWDVDSGALRHMLYLRDATYAVRSLRFGPGDRELLVCGGDATARVLSLDGKEVARLPHGDIVEAVDWSADGKWMATGSDDRTVKIWPAWDGREVATVTVRECCDPRNAFAFDLHPEGRLAALGVWDIKLLDIETGATLAAADFGSLTLGVRFSHDGGMLAVCGKVEAVSLLETKTLTAVRTISHPTFVSETAFDRGATRIATACWDGIVRVFDIRDGGLFRSFGIGGLAAAVQFSPDDKYLAACSQNMSLVVWEVNSGVEVFRKELESLPWSVEFDPLSRLVACAGDGVRVFEVSTGSEFMRWKGSANSVKFSHDGKALAAAASDGVRVWDAARYRETAFIPNTGGARDVAFRPDGRYLVTAGKTDRDCVIRTWFVGVDDLIEEARRRVPRDLSEEERSIYLASE